MSEKEKKVGNDEQHDGFQRFNLIRRMTREWIVRGYRDYTEYSVQAKSTYLGQVEHISHALSPYMRWNNIGNPRIQIEKMRISRNPIYLLLKSRSMKSGMNYFLHFALLEMLSKDEELALAEIHHKLSSGFSEAEADRMEIHPESLATFLPAEPYSYVEYNMQKKLEMQLEFFVKGENPIIHRGRDNKYRRRRDAAENVSMHPSDLAVAIMYILSGNKAFSIDELQTQMRKRLPHFLSRYGYQEGIRKNTLQLRLDNQYVSSEILKKDKVSKKYSLASSILSDMLLCYPGLKSAIAFYSEYSPLGIIGSCLMDTYDFEDDSVVFKDIYIVQALDSIVLYDILSAMQKNKCITAYMEQVSGTMLEKREVLPLKILTCAGDGRRYVYSFDLENNVYRSLRLDFIHEVCLIEKQLCEQEIKQIREIGQKKLEHVWTEFVGESVFPVRIEMFSKEKIFASEIRQERRNSQVIIHSDGVARITSKVYHPKEMIPWLLAHTGDVTALEVERDEKNNKDSSRMINRYREHICTLHEMYQGNGEARDISKYIASPDMRAWYGKLNGEQRVCFEYIWNNRKRIVSEEKLKRKRTSEEKLERYSEEGKLKKAQILRESFCILISEAKKKYNIGTESDSVTEDEVFLYKRLVCIANILRKFSAPRTKHELVSIIIQAKKDMDIENDETITFERLKAKGLLKRPMKYPPVDENKLKGIRTAEDTSPLFHAFRSKYIACMGYVLKQTAQPHTQEEIEDIIILAKRKYSVNSEDQEVSFDNLYRSGMIQNYSYHLGLLGVSVDGSSKELYCSYLLHADAAPICPMLPHEANWIRSILKDGKINLFLTKEEVKGIEAKLGKGPTLYSTDDIIWLDKYKDGDEFSSSVYQKVFSCLQNAILKAADEVKVWYQTENQKRDGIPAMLYHIKPIRLEYSMLSDRINLIGMFTKDPPEGSPLIERSDTGCLYMKFSNILQVDDNNTQFNSGVMGYEEAMCEDPLVIRVYNIYGAVERFMLMMTMYKKEVLYEDATDTCLVTMWYSKRDEKSVMKKVRSLGCAVEVLAPDRRRKEIEELVERQYKRVQK